MKEKIKIIEELSHKHLIYSKANSRWQFQHSRVIRDAEKYHQTKLTNRDITDVLTRPTRERLIDLKNKDLPYEKIIDENTGEFVEEGSMTIRSRSASAQGDVQLEVVMWLSPDIEKTDDYVLDVIGHNDGTKIIKNIQYSFWGTGYNKAGKELHNYAIKLQLGNKTLDSFTPADYVKHMENMNFVPIYENITEIEQVNKEEDIFIWHITDIHFGSKFSMGHRLVSQAKHIINEHKDAGVSKLVIAFTGDILHVDSVSKQTTRGTQLETPMTIQEMYEQALNELYNVIILLNKHFKLEVIWTQGNHSRMFEWGLMQHLADKINGEYDIPFDVSSDIRKAFLWGESLIGLTHGDMPKKQQFHWLQYEFSYLWGIATNYTVIQGHTHGLKVEPLSVLSEGKTIVRTGPAMKTRDEYEEGQGYQDLGPQTLLYTVNRTKGFYMTEQI